MFSIKFVKGLEYIKGFVISITVEQQLHTQKGGHKCKSLQFLSV